MVVDSSMGAGASSVKPLTPTVRPAVRKILLGIFRILPRMEQEEREVRMMAEAMRQIDLIMGKKTVG